MTRTLEDLSKINRVIAAAFDQRERRAWTIEASVIELAKQVGDLARAIMTSEGYYLEDRDQSQRYRGTAEAIGDELADIFYCVIRIADHYSIDLEQAHLAARTKEWAYLGNDDPPPWTE